MDKFIAFIVLCFIFIPVERLFTLRTRQKVLRKGWKTDIVHFFVNNVFTQIGMILLMGLTLLMLDTLVPGGIREAVAAQPGWLQFIEAFLIAETMGYVGHRMAHTVPFLWKFHAVHHSIEEMDWLASARTHPLDQVFIRAWAIVPLYALGFSRETFGIYLVVATLQALFVHSNVRLTFGPLRWLIATPEFHHWHHANDAEARNTNFAGQLPVIDFLMGTLHLPRRWPKTYGCDEPVPKGHYLRQLAFPFRKAAPLEDSSASYAPDLADTIEDGPPAAIPDELAAATFEDSGSSARSDALTSHG